MKEKLDEVECIIFIMNWQTMLTRPHAAGAPFAYSVPISGRKGVIPAHSAGKSLSGLLKTLRHNAELLGLLCTAPIILLGVTGLMALVGWYSTLRLIVNLRGRSARIDNVKR